MKNFLLAMLSFMLRGCDYYRVSVSWLDRIYIPEGTKTTDLLAIGVEKVEVREVLRNQSSMKKFLTGDVELHAGRMKGCDYIGISFLG